MAFSRLSAPLPQLAPLGVAALLCRLQLGGQTCQIIKQDQEITDKRLLERFMQEIVPILDQLLVERIEKPLVDALGIAECDHMFVHFSELLREITFLHAADFSEPDRHRFFQILQTTVQSPGFHAKSARIARCCRRLPQGLSGSAFSASALNCCMVEAKSSVILSSAWPVRDWSYRQKSADRLDQPRDIVPACFHGDSQPSIPRRLGGDRPDAGNLHSSRPGQP